MTATDPTSGDVAPLLARLCELAERQAAATASLWSVDVVARETTLGASTIERLIRDPESDFPRPRQLSAGRRGWLPADVRAWLAERPKKDM